jgi:chemotaxis protein MotB
MFKINNLNKFINELEGKIIKKENALTNEKEMNKKLEQTVKQLKEEISKLNYALEVSEELIRKNNVQIAEYSRLLNRALANKAAELHKYRSEFFENVSKVIKENKLFKVEGDRFILQSEILFPSGKAKLTNKGMSTLYSIYRELSKMYDKIPQDINWVLRVDGHTDNIPVKTTTYKSNWDLAAARAISVTEYLVSAGLPEERVIAASFGEHHPIASNKSKKGRQQNRRIEFKLTNK